MYAEQMMQEIKLSNQFHLHSMRRLVEEVGAEEEVGRP
jgi:hypothetical protein